MGSDSAVYFAAADNWLKGFGLSWVQGGGEATPVIHYPPLYSLLLAGLQVLGIPMQESARALNLVFFAISGITVGVLSVRLTGSRLLGLLGLVLALFCGELLSVHSWAMSEALYIGLGSMAVVFLSGYVRERRRWALTAGSISMALASLTRYIGVSLPLLGAVVLAFDEVSPRRRPLRRSGLFLVASAAPVLLWLAWSSVWGGAPGGRTVGWNVGILPGLVRQSMATILNWFLPLRLAELLSRLPPLAATLVSAAAVMCVVGLWLAGYSRLVPGDVSPSRGEVVLPIIWPLLHVGSLLAAAVLTFPETHVSERTLSPAYPPLVIALVVVAAAVWRTRRWILRAFLVTAVLLLVRNKAVYAYWVVHGLQQDGQRYASAAWRTSPTIAALKQLEPPLIYTDDIAAVYLLADRYSYSIPRRLDAVTGDPVESYPADLETMRRRIAQEGAVLVLFDPQHIPADMAPLEDLTQGLCPLQTLADGVIYAACAPESGT